MSHDTNLCEHGILPAGARLASLEQARRQGRLPRAARLVWQVLSSGPEQELEDDRNGPSSYRPPESPIWAAQKLLFYPFLFVHIQEYLSPPTPEEWFMMP